MRRFGSCLEMANLKILMMRLISMGQEVVKKMAE
jgi:hypothetical protein